MQYYKSKKVVAMFEYKVLTINIRAGLMRPAVDDAEIENAINDYGNKGWELIGVACNGGANGYLSSHTLYFKRAKN